MKATRQKRLLLRTDGCSQTGMRHVMRCVALAQAWRANGGEVLFLLSDESRESRARLERFGFDSCLVPGCPGNGQDAEATAQVISSFYADWLALDGYHFDLAYQQYVAKGNHRLLFIDDLGIASYAFSDIISNQTLNAKTNVYSVPQRTRVLLGPCYALLRSQFRRRPRKRRVFPKRARKVLVIMGGSDPENYAGLMLQNLKPLTDLELEIQVAVGLASPHANNLQAMADTSPLKIKILQRESIPEAMAWSDVAISASGITAWELAFMGVPTLLTITNSHQWQIANTAEANGFAVNLGKAEHLIAPELSGQLSELLADAGRRSYMSEQGMKLVDGKGTERLMALLLEPRSTRQTITQLPMEHHQ